MPDNEYRSDHAALGRILKHYRLEADMSLDNAAAGLNIPASELDKWERGRGYLPASGKLQEILAFYPMNRDDQRELETIYKKWRTRDALGAVTATRPGGPPKKPLNPPDTLIIDTHLAKMAVSRPISNPTTQAGIFISYRRSDEPWYARTLCTKLRGKFRKVRLFIDIDDIGPGADFAAVIDEAVSKCVVLIVVIGKGWLNVADSSGARRLDDPEDLVRLEIERALARDILVIPILVDGASMPRRADLPESLRPLSGLNGQVMSYAGFGQDCLKLVSTLERILGTQSP